MTIDLKELRRIFQQRNTELRPPASDYEWAKLERELVIGIGQDFIGIYKLFDGFINYDTKSQIRLWSLDEIATNIQGKDYLREHRDWAVVGDFLLESDLIVANVTETRAIVKRAYEDVVMSDSLCEFLQELAFGKFDFL